MLKVEDFPHLVNVFKANYGTVITNNYLTSTKLDVVLKAKETEISVLDDALLLKYIDNGIVRILFYISSTQKLAEAIRTSNFKGILEIITNTRVNQPIELPFKKLGRLQKYSLIKKGYTGLHLINQLDVDLATFNDCDDLHQLLYNIFDSRISHLPTLDNVIEAIAKKEVSIIRNEEGKIVAGAFFEVQGARRKYLYQIFVDKNYRGYGYGEALLAHELFNHKDNCNYSLWVADENFKAIRLYEKYGFINIGQCLDIFEV